MLVCVYGADDVVAKWAAKRIAPAGGLVFKDFAAIGVADGGKPIAAFVFHEYRQPSIELSIASDSPKWLMSPRVLRELFSYPFNQLGCARITTMADTANERIVAFNRRFGWVEEGRIREASPTGSDVIVFGMLRRECRYLVPRGTYGEKASITAAAA